MIEKILERLEEEKSDWNNDYNVPINRAIEIVQEVAKEYEGRVIELPCKVGDTFWELSWTEDCAYSRVAHSLSHVVYCMERLGKWCFLTKAEAEEALAKMGGKHEEM